MRVRKIRGHNRIHRQIEKWKFNSLSYNLTPYLENENHKDYIKIYVSPYCDLSITNSIIPEPKGKTKKTYFIFTIRNILALGRTA